ncbi:hypothetical protein Syun_008980 [Stephania yunnanensis]|uniref:Uncharacterized protein n=1 Tax=Stephania yunnanensis TaxID=152371 RepID=A0AAP0PRV5_9MAGN
MASAVVSDLKPTVVEPGPSSSSSKSGSNGLAEQSSPLVEEEEEDLHGRLESLRRELELINIQEERVEDELKNLKRELQMIRRREISRRSRVRVSKKTPASSRAGPNKTIHTDH